MEKNTINEVEKKVLDFLKKQQEEIKGTNLIAVHYGVGAKDLIKFIERPEECGRWPFDFVGMAQRAVNLISKNYFKKDNTSNNKTADLFTKEKEKKTKKINGVKI